MFIIIIIIVITNNMFIVFIISKLVFIIFVVVIERGWSAAEGSAPESAHRVGRLARSARTLPCAQDCAEPTRRRALSSWTRFSHAVHPQVRQRI